MPRQPRLRRADRRILNKLAWRRSQVGVSERRARIENFVLERYRLELASIAALGAGGRPALYVYILKEWTDGRARDRRETTAR